MGQGQNSYDRVGMPARPLTLLSGCFEHDKQSMFKNDHINDTVKIMPSFFFYSFSE